MAVLFGIADTVDAADTADTADTATCLSRKSCFRDCPRCLVHERKERWPEAHTCQGILGLVGHKRHAFRSGHHLT